MNSIHESQSISVVIPLYNKENTIEACLGSVIQQTVAPSELIIVNDGSTDSSLEISREVLATYQGHYTIIDQKNSGVSVARNVGIKASNSKFIALLDADDEWYPHFIEKALVLLKDYPEADLYCFAHRVYDASIGIFQPKQGLPPNFRGYVDDFFQSSLKGSVAKSSKVIVRKKAITKIGGYPESAKVCEDIFVWIMLALNGKVAFDSYVATLVKQLPDNSRSKRTGEVPYPLFYFRSHKNLNQLPKNAKRYIRKIYLLQVYSALIKQDKVKAKKILEMWTINFPLISISLWILSELNVSQFFLYFRKIQRKFLAKQYDK